MIKTLHQLHLHQSVFHFSLLTNATVFSSLGFTIAIFLPLDQQKQYIIYSALVGIKTA